MAEPPPLTVHALRRLGAEALRRANDAMAHARHAGPGGSAGYTPLPETAAEHAGMYVVSEGSLGAALRALDHQIAGAHGHENVALWREARAVLAAALAPAETHPAGGPDGTPGPAGA